MAAESEVSFSDLDGSTVRVGILRTRWNDEHVSNLVDGIKVRLSYIHWNALHKLQPLTKSHYLQSYATKRRGRRSAR